MSTVSPSPFHSSNADFVRAVSRKFPDGRFLIVGASSQEVEGQFADAKREASIMSSSGDLATKLEQRNTAAHFETAVWFYSSGENDYDRIAEVLSRCADSIVLLPGPGAEATGRRPQLVQCFERFGLMPDYECDVMELDPAALCLQRQPGVAAGARSEHIGVARSIIDCMLTRREVFQQAGGFDENLEGALADVDLCLKIRRAGYLIVYTPFAKLCWHQAPADQIDMKGETIMRERWAGILRRDPYYNPNLSRERANFSLGK
jgi:hypothetical protein